MPKGTPYVIDVIATSTARLLVYLDGSDMDAHDFVHLANDTLVDYTYSLIAQVQKTAGLPDNKYVTFDVDIRPSMGAEIGGDDALDEGILRFDYYDHDDHDDHDDHNRADAFDTDEEEEAA